MRDLARWTAAALALLISVALGRSLNFSMRADYILSLAYLAVFGSAVAFGCYLTLVGRIGADRASYATLLFPIIALIISTLFEGYHWTPPALAGVVIILAGNTLSMTGDQIITEFTKMRQHVAFLEYTSRITAR